MYNIFLYVHILFSPLRTFGNLNHEKSIIWIFRKMDPLQVASLQSSSRKEGILVPQKTFWNVGFHGYWISGCKKKSFGLVRWRVFTHEVGRVGIYGCWMLRCKCVLFFTEAWTYHSRPCSKKTGLFSDAYIYIYLSHIFSSWTDASLGVSASLLPLRTDGSTLIPDAQLIASCQLRAENNIGSTEGKGAMKRTWHLAGKACSFSEIMDQFIH